MADRCGHCYAPMPPHAVSEWFCCPLCQDLWHNARVTRPREVYAAPDAVCLVAVDVTDMRAGNPLKPARDLLSIEG